MNAPALVVEVQNGNQVQEGLHRDLTLAQFKLGQAAILFGGHIPHAEAYKVALIRGGVIKTLSAGFRQIMIVLA